MKPLVQTVILLIISNSFMTYAWYGHLKDFKHHSLWIVILLAWGIALFEYIFQVPANRIGYASGGLKLEQLKILQEVIALSVFMPFAIVYMKQPISLNFLWASLCILGAIYFIFR